MEDVLRSIDLSLMITMTEPRPRYTGAYSDVYIGKCSEKTVCEQMATKSGKTGG